MFEIAEDFRLLGIALGPLPFLQQLFVPGETIDVGLRVATRARVAVPIPGTADRFAGFINPYLQPQFVAQSLEHIHARETCPDHDSVKVLSGADHVSLRKFLSRNGSQLSLAALQGGLECAIAMLKQPQLLLVQTASDPRKVGKRDSQLSP